MSITKLMAQTFQNLLLGLLLTIIQKCHCNLQIIPHTLFSNNTAVYLLLQPLVHNMIDFAVRCSDGQGTVFVQIIFHGLLTGTFRTLSIRIHFSCRSCLIQRFTDAEDHPDFLRLARLQYELMLQHTAKNKQCRLRIRTVTAIYYYIRSLKQCISRSIQFRDRSCRSTESGQIPVISIHRLGSSQISIVPFMRCKRMSGSTIYSI